MTSAKFNRFLKMVSDLTISNDGIIKLRADGLSPWTTFKGMFIKVLLIFQIGLESHSDVTSLC